MRRRPFLVAVAAALCIPAAGCGDQVGESVAGEPGPPPAELRVEVVAVHPHDTDAFTQGLEVDGGELLEGTGREGHSWVAAGSVDGGVERTRVHLPDDLFGEGLTVAGDTVWQLTWQNGVALARDRDDLAERDRVEYDGEGWGLCAQSDRLVMSDGSAELTFRDRDTFAELGRVTVHREGRAVSRLNELECTDDGAVYANVWQTDEIVRIDPQSGRVTARIDAGALREQLTAEQREGIDVLNGIAHLPGTDRFLVTGKYWPKLFEVRFVS
ncbi:glutaminyl-peptide cyclotransferase [Rhodococcus sp. CC-R104]|uniref:Glutaminyl-peptide cyclotransferase n=1 Tax=Rhodococcus chondri TaxID=3065941 RepID=A0ABU7JS27_9NOCA|nr:glutaminyl-peptide cyclotransferase [Rhodococcus sp. CC-R104]MEE2032838.1 glutaminyl-peptide cyclotransferase [Rhodococcus sp. CC-R104]